MYNPAHPGRDHSGVHGGSRLDRYRAGRAPEDHAGQSVADDPRQDWRIGRDGRATFRGVRDFSRGVDQVAGQLRSGKGHARQAREDCAIGRVNRDLGHHFSCWGWVFEIRGTKFVQRAPATS